MKEYHAIVKSSSSSKPVCATIAQYSSSFKRKRRVRKSRKRERERESRVNEREQREGERREEQRYAAKREQRERA